MFIIENQGKHFCQCGCGKEIIIKRQHKSMGIPKYIVGHQIINNNPCKNPEVRKKISQSLIGDKNPWYGKRHSEESIKKMSESKNGDKNPRYGKHNTEDHNKKIGNSNKGKILGIKRTEETKSKLSKSHTGLCGELSSNWQGGKSFEPYCPKFNEKRKEEVREQYGRKCVICVREEKDNITKTGKFNKLSVHHVDSDKEQGCKGKPWRLVPLCMHCHNSKKSKVLKC